jgi:palmitoyl-protein thioesterase
VLGIYCVNWLERLSKVEHIANGHRRI